LQIARILLDKKKYSEATAHLETVVQKYPSSIPALTLLGLAFFSQNNPSKAKVVWAECLELNPHSIEARTLLDKLP
jgi:cytochrome c-type biogenesis protein CcmH/NrfG